MPRAPTLQHECHWKGTPMPHVSDLFANLHPEAIGFFCKKDGAAERCFIVEKGLQKTEFAIEHLQRKALRETWGDGRYEVWLTFGGGKKPIPAKPKYITIVR